MNAARKPTMSAIGEMPSIAVPKPCFAMSITSRSASPSTGGMTIRKENCAIRSFLLPKSSPVAMVVPDLDRPGSTATACPIPMMKACNGEISSR